MKIRKIIFLFIVLIGGLMLNSCNKEEKNVISYESTSKKSTSINDLFNNDTKFFMTIPLI